DGFVDQHVVIQLLAWEAAASFILDRGMAYRFIVKYGSKGEWRSKEVQKMITETMNAAHALAGDERKTMTTMLKWAMMKATTRRDMGVQEVMPNLLQMESIFAT
ncbi:unnamed protein product, partial [Hapterophycus canaliculatus]